MPLKRHPLKYTLACIAMAVLCACAHVPAGPGAEPDRDAAVNALLDEDYAFKMRTYPVWASTIGDRRFDAELTDNSPAAIEARLGAISERLERARAVDPAGLTEVGRTNLDLLVYELEKSVKGAAFKSEQIPITQMGGPHTWLPQLPDRLSFTTEKHLEDYALRLEKIPASLDQTLAHMRAGMAAGNVPPKVVMAGVMVQMDTQTTEAHRADPRTHAFFKPFRERDPDDPLARRAAETIAKGILPALERLKTFTRDTYIPACRQSIGASESPWGAEYYNFRLESYTTLPLTAEEIHETGLAEVARIRAEMMETIARSDFAERDTLSGDALFAAFTQYLRQDPRFYHTSSEAMLEQYAYICKQMDAALPKLFKRLPRLPYGIKAMPDYVAASGPTAYYYSGSAQNGVAGNFMVNTSALDQRPIYEMKALAYHEAVPGHHLQIALSQELEEGGLHKWRELVGYTAYVEGWALYSERLGLEVGGAQGQGRGFYEDPYDDFGRLSYEMWRALRLVVDTGIHAMGWSRQRAIDLMLANSALTEKNIENEVDRYISWPGQAVAYKVGELRIRALRQRAEAALGQAFDIRDFHDVVLGSGAIPLPVLERRVEVWIAAGSAGSP